MNNIVPKLRISVVSYTNTKPFLFGLTHFSKEVLACLTIEQDVPARCAEKLLTGKSDIGLVPVASLLSLPSYEIISDYCISADGAVGSVALYSHKPIINVQTVQLDSESMTSNKLVQILCQRYWRIQPVYLTGTTVKADAKVLIGDRTFGEAKKYPYVYDLSACWKSLTGLPFVFAVWAARNPIDVQISTLLNKAFDYGILHRLELLDSLPAVSHFDLRDYLLTKIEYKMSADKQKALAQYLTWVRELRVICELA